VSRAARRAVVVAALAMIGCGDGPRRGPPPNAGVPSLEPTRAKAPAPASPGGAQSQRGDGAGEPNQPAPTRVDMPAPTRVGDGKAEAASTSSEPQPTPTEGLAPLEVRCKRLALALLLDRSGSMTGLPMQRAREAASAAVGELGPDDCIEVVAFDSEPRRVVPMRTANARGEITAAIAGIKEGGGTEYFGALDLAHADLSRVAARRKAVLMVTDGKAPSAGLPRLLEMMKKASIAVSAIGLGPDADEEILRQMASATGGRARQVRVADDLPKAVLAEVREVLKAAKR
jgi:uncharacterized protein YegL